MKLVIVSNRLPVSLTEKEGRLEFAQSPGGLASGLRTYLESPRSAVGAGYAWVGWPGRAVAPKQQAEVTRRCRKDFSARPVFLTVEDTEGFYEGYCNQTLWPLFHYFPALVSFDEGPWATYELINEVFCDAVLEEAGPDDTVWVHDYHFLLLPAMLRRRRPGQKVGFFLHIPFPSYELFRLVPDRWRRALLEGMLGADLVGFHTHDYAQYFLKSVRRILGYDHQMGRVMLPDRLSRVETFPMGVEFEAFSARGAEPEVTRKRNELRGTIGGGKAVLSIDRLDYSKGIANRLLAYQAFLEANPDWRGRVVLLMIVVPSRTGVEDYQRMKSRIDELVGAVNGTFGSLEWTPVLYQYKSFPQQELVPLYGASDVMLVTPLRDGMNLVAKEYVAARADGRGVLILSEMTGAASELGEAVLVNPNDIPEMVRALETALEMPEEEQARRMTALRDRLRRYDVVRWADDFLEALGEDRSRLDRRDAVPRNAQADRPRVPVGRPTPAAAGLRRHFDFHQADAGAGRAGSRAAGDARPAGRAGRRGHRQRPSPRDARRLAGAAPRGAGGRARGVDSRAGRGLGRDGGPLRRLEARGPRPDGAVRRPTARGAG